VSVELLVMNTWLIGLMWTLPFIYPYHQHPLTTFYPEWMTVAIGLIAATVRLCGRNRTAMRPHRSLRIT
jgi:hypothetical protein